MAYNPRNHLRGSRGANRRANKTPGQKSAWEREGVWWTLGSSWHKKKELKTRESLLSLLHQKVIFFLLFFCRYLTKRKSKENQPKSGFAKISHSQRSNVIIDGDDDSQLVPTSFFESSFVFLTCFELCPYVILLGTPICLSSLRPSISRYFVVATAGTM